MQLHRVKTRVIHLGMWEKNSQLIQISETLQHSVNKGWKKSCAELHLAVGRGDSLRCELSSLVFSGNQKAKVPVEWTPPTSTSTAGGQESFFIWASPKYLTCFVFLLLLSSVSEEKKNGFQLHNVPSLIDCSCVPVIYFHMLDCSTLSERCRVDMSAFRTFETFVSLLAATAGSLLASKLGRPVKPTPSGSFPELFYTL